MPPVPSSDLTSYSPTFVPGVSVIRCVIEDCKKLERTSSLAASRTSTSCRKDGSETQERSRRAALFGREFQRLFKKVANLLPALRIHTSVALAICFARCVVDVDHIICCVGNEYLCLGVFDRRHVDEWMNRNRSVRHRARACHASTASIGAVVTCNVGGWIRGCRPRGGLN
jgi:hypothetical protein